MENKVSLKVIPEPSLRRLSKYIDFLSSLEKENIKHVSSSLIAEKLGLDSIQVRKDLSITGAIGKPKVGFELEELLAVLKHTLNWDNVTDAFLVGVGSLGSAIICYKDFSSYGLNIISAFDNDPSKSGTIINGIEIFPVEKLADKIKQMNIHIGILTVPAESAQHIAEVMIEAGISAIWNFAPVHLKVPQEVIVENIQLTESLGILTYRLTKKLTNQNN